MPYFLVIVTVEEFEVLFFGKPLNMSTNSIEFVTAFSNTFGQGKGFTVQV